MATLTDYLLSKDQINGIYTIKTVSHPKIEEQFGTISIVKVTLNNKENKPLVIIPGYSDKSFMSGFESIIDGFDSYKDKYSVMYAVCWGSTVKEVTVAYTKPAGDNQEKQYELNEEIRIILAKILDKILRSPDMELTNITLFGKSAGAGICIHIAAMNPYVQYLYISCPGTNSYGRVLKNQKELKIKLAWNEDDDVLPYSESQKFIQVFETNENKYKFYDYKTGGHEFNPSFIEEL
jgi:cephalosporin-C deacetylase-like acetyl esterase